MKIIKKTNELENILESVKDSAQSIGLVLTMGNIHDGHVSLIEEAKNEEKEVFKNFDATKADHIAASFILQSYLNDPKLAENC